MDSDCRAALKELQSQLWAAWDAFFFAPPAVQPSAMERYRQLMQQNQSLIKKCMR